MFRRSLLGNGRSNVTADDGTVLSDAPVDDFEYLNVTITKVGVTNQEFEQEVEREIESECDGNASKSEIEAAYEFKYEADNWNETDVDAETVDLTEMKGDRAVRLTNLSISLGSTRQSTSR